MRARIKIVNEETKQVLTMSLKSNEAWAMENGYSKELYEVEQGYDGNLYLAEYSPKKPLEEIKFDKLTEINAVYEEKAKLIKINTPTSEILTWDIQKDEAESWKKDSTMITPFCDGLSVARGIDRVTLLEKVLANVSTFNSYMATLTGERQKYEDMIKQATTPEEVEVITWKS